MCSRDESAAAHLIDEEHARHNLCLALLPPLRHLAVNLLPDLQPAGEGCMTRALSGAGGVWAQHATAVPLPPICSQSLSMGGRDAATSIESNRGHESSCHPAAVTLHPGANAQPRTSGRISPVPPRKKQIRSRVTH